MTKKLNLSLSRTNMRFLMVSFVLIMYVVSFTLDSAATSSRIGLHIGNGGVSYALFTELLILLPIGMYYSWKTGDIVFALFLTSSGIVFFMLLGSVIGRWF